MNRYLKRILLASLGVFLLFACFGLGLLLYALGEPNEIDLGYDKASFVMALQEQTRLGHAVLMDGGERVYFFDGVRYEVHVLTTLERLGLALSRAFGGDYGQAVSQVAPVSSLIIWPIGRAFIYVFAFGLFSFIPGLLFPKERNLRRSLLFSGIALFLLGFALGFFLGFSLPYVGLPFLAGGLLLALLSFNAYFPNGKPYARSLFVTFLFAMGVIGFFALYPALQEAGSLLRYAIAAKDNHVYAVMGFFLGLLVLAPLYVFILLKLRKPKEAA